MEDKAKHYSIDISSATIVRILVTAAILGFLYLIRDVVAVVFFAVMLILIIQPIVSWLNHRHIPRGLAITLLYITIIACLAGAISLLIKPVTEQFAAMGQAMGTYTVRTLDYFGLSSVNPLVGVETLFSNITKYIPDPTFDVVGSVRNFFDGIVTVLIVLIITFYGLIDESAFKRLVRTTVPSEYQPYLYQVSLRIQKKLGMWLRGQLVLGIVMFALTWIGLTLLGVKYALVLALISGILELIPYIGPIFSGTLAVFLNVFDNPVRALLIGALYVVIQQTENHILVPKIMQKATGLNPIVSIVALLIGARLGGAVGIILAIPVANVLNVFVSDFVDQREAKQNSLDYENA